MPKSYSRVATTKKADAFIDAIIAKNGEIIFHQSGGCCDGSAILCMGKEEFYLGSNDLYIGDFNQCGFYMHSDNFTYFEHTHLTLDVEEGKASSFSLEAGSGKRFVTKSRLFSKEEEKNLFTVETN